MFENDDGEIGLTKPFAKRMTWAKALELSIQKWEFILSEVENNNSVKEDGGDETCALCYRKDLPGWQHCTSKCPVGKGTGSYGCNNTPYKNVDFEVTKTIIAEVDFLKSLRA